MKRPTFLLYEGNEVLIRYARKDGTHQALAVTIKDDAVTLWSISGTLLKEPARIVIQNHPDVAPTIAQLEGGFSP